MTDEEFLQALERCELPADHFRHAAHVRAAYLYCRGRDEEEALNAIRSSLQRYVAHLGKADRYNEAMTRRYLSLMRRRMAERGDAGGWAAFALANPDLLSSREPALSC
jgi:hypothetical protein